MDVEAKFVRATGRTSVRCKKKVRFTPDTSIPTPKSVSHTRNGAPSVDVSWRGQLRRYFLRPRQKNDTDAYLEAVKLHKEVKKAWKKYDREVEERRGLLKKWAARGWKVDDVHLHPDTY